MRLPSLAGLKSTVMTSPGVRSFSMTRKQEPLSTIEPPLNGPAGWQALSRAGIEPSAQPRAESSQSDLVVGTGTVATSGRLLTVNYSGWLYDPPAAEQKGRLFELVAVAGTPAVPVHARHRRSDPRLGPGVVGMRVGGRRRLVIPPELAHGLARCGQWHHLAERELVFDIERLNVQ